MSDFLTGLIPETTEPQFLDPIPASAPLPPMSKPLDVSQIRQQSDQADPVDFVTDMFDKFKQQKPSFAVQSASVDFNAKDMGAAMYRGAEQFKTYGLSLTGNNEETYGQLQTGWDRTKRAVGGAFALGANQFVEQAASWGDTFNFLKDNKAAFEQSDMDEINKHQEDFQNKYHIFHTAKEDATIFNWATVADTVQQSGYALGAIAEIIAEEAALTALSAVTMGGMSGLQAARAVQQGVSFSRMFRRVAEVGEVTNEVSRARKIFNGIQKVNPFLDNTLNFAFDAKNILRGSQVAGETAPLMRTIGKGFGSFYRDLREFNMAVSEAKAEAAGVNQDLTRKLLNQYKSENGIEPTGDDLVKIQETALKAAQTDGIWNTYLIMATNKIAIGNIMGGFKPLRSLEISAGRNILMLSDKQALKAGGGKVMNKLVDATDNKWLAFKQSLLRKPLSYMKTNITEAGQENLQDVIKDGTQNYYASKYAHENSTNGENPMKSMYDTMIEGAGNQFSVQGAKTFISGFFTGAIIGPVNHLMGQSGNIKQFTTDRKGYTARQAEAKSKRAETISSFNDIYNNPLTFGYKMGNASLQANFGELLKVNAQSGDKKGFNDIKDDATRHMILTGIQSGALDTMIERLQDLPGKLSKEEFATAFGLENTKENIDNLSAQIDNFADRAQEVKAIHEKVADKFKNPFNTYHERFKDVDKQTDPEYIKEAMGHMAWNDAVNNLVFMKDYYNQNMRRSLTMLNSMKGKAGFENVAFNDVHLLTSLDNIAGEIDMLDSSIQSLEQDTVIGSKKMLAEKKARLTILEKYHEHLSKWQDDFDENSTLKEGNERTLAFQKSFDDFQQLAVPLFTKYVNTGLKENGHGVISNDNVDSAFINLHDYMKAQKESGIVLDKINLLADPANFAKFFVEHDVMTRILYNGAINPEFSENIQKRQEQRIKDEIEAESKTAEALIAAQKIEDEKKAEAEKELIKSQKAAADAVEVERIRHEKELSDAKDAIKKAAAEKLHLEKLAEIETKRLADIAAHNLKIKLAAEELERVNIQQKKEADDRAKKHQEEIEALRIATEKLKTDAEAAAKLAAENATPSFEAQRAAIDKMTDPEERKTAEIKLVMSLLFSKVGEAASLKIKEYVDRIIAGQPREKVIEGLSPSFIAGIDQLLAASGVTPSIIISAGDKEQVRIQEIVDKIEATTTTSELNLIAATVANVDFNLKKVYAAFAKQQDKILIEESKLPEVIDENAQYDAAEETNPTTFSIQKKSESAHSTTGVETINIDTEEIDAEDQAKILYYKILNKFKSGVDFKSIELAPGRKGLTITAVNPTKLFTQSGTTTTLNEMGKKSLEKSTLEWLANGDSAMTQFMQSTVFVLSDNEGTPYTFDKDGNFSYDGTIVTTNMRKPGLKDGRYFLSNAKIQSIGERTSAIIKAGGIFIEDKLTTDNTIIEKLVDVAQQADLKKLYDIRKLLSDNPGSTYTFQIESISQGVVKIDKNNPTRISEFLTTNFKLIPITDNTKVDATHQLGGVYFRIDGYNKDVLVVRPNISEELADIISLLLFTPGKIDSKDAFDFIMAHVYTKSNDLWFRHDVQNNKVIAELGGQDVVNHETTIAAFKRELMKRKVNIVTKLIDKDFKNITSDIGTGGLKVEKISYNDYVKNNFLTYISLTDTRTVTPRNAYIKFDMSSFVSDNTAPIIDDIVSNKVPDKTQPDINAVNPTSAKKENKNNSDKSSPTPDQIIADHLAFLDGLDKATGIDNTATPTQITAAEQWWNNSPLSKHIPLNVMMDIVNSNAIAHWTQTGITLFNGANHTDVYHEAWHGFTQLYLTKEQKAILYAEGRTIFPGKTDLEIEETLAEDFRKYVLSDGKQVLNNRPVTNSIFRKIINFLRSLFTGVKYSDLMLQTEAITHINELYQKLHTGKLNEYSPSVHNIQFGKLNKGMQLGGTILSTAESIMISNTIDSLVRSTIGNVNKIAEQSGNKLRNIGNLFENPKFKSGVFSIIKQEFIKITANGNDYQKVLSKLVVDHFDAVMEYHSRKSKYLKNAGIIQDAYDATGQLIEKPEEGDDSQDVQRTKDPFDNSGAKSSMKEDASNETLYLVAGLNEKNTKGENVLNELGVPKLADFSKTWNRLIKTLSGKISAVDMYNALLESRNEYPEMDQLARELGDPNDYDGNNTKFNLWQKFRQDLSHVRIGLMEAHLQKETNAKGEFNYNFKFIEARPDTQIVTQQFTANFQSQINSPYIFINTNGENVLNVTKVLADFTTESTSKKGVISVKVDPKRRFEFLNEIGFNLSDKPAIRAGLEEIASKIDYIAGALRDLNEGEIVITDPIDQLSKDNGSIKFKGESNNIRLLLQLEARNSDDFSNFSVENAAGDKSYEHSLHNGITNQMVLLNDAVKFPTYQSLMQVPEMAPFDISKNPLIRNSIWLNSMFDLKTGFRRMVNEKAVSIKLVNISGVKEIIDGTGTDKGVTTSALDGNGKFLLDFNSLLTTGVMELPRAEAKSSFYSIVVSDLKDTSGSFKNLFFSVENFNRGDDYMNSDIYDYIKGAMIGELTMTAWLNGPDQIGSDIEGYKERVKKFRLFDGILSDATKTKLLEIVKDGEPIDFGDQIDAMDEVLIGEFKYYFKKLELENGKKLGADFYVGTELMNRLKSLLYNQNHKSEYTDSQLRRILNKTFTINSWVANVEAVKFVYGDPAFYNLGKNEFHKRIPAFGSTKSTLNLDISAINHVNDMGRLVARNSGIAEKKFDGTFGVRIYQDVRVDSKYYDNLFKTFTEKYKTDFPNATVIEIKEMVIESLKPYTQDDIKESDAQGYITLDALRIIEMLQGNWNPKMEALYIKAAAGEELTSKELSTFFNVKKAQYAGLLQTDKLYVPAFHKFSLIPLIPSMIKGTNMEEVNKDMMRTGHDYATFVSGSKIGIIGKPAPFYSDKASRIINLSNDTNTTFTTNTVFARYFGEQLKIDPKWKKEVIFSTQMRKLIDLGLTQQGVPIDYPGTKTEWDALSVSQKLSASNVFLKYRAFENGVNKLTALKKEKLISEAKIEWSKGAYRISDFGPIISIIKKEFEGRDMPDHVVDFFDLGSDNKIKTPLDLSTQSQKIEGVIQSIINNRLIRQKVNGEALIQVAGTGFEKFRNASDEDIAKYGNIDTNGTNDLPFYQEVIRNGVKVTSAMKIKIALSGDYLNLFELNHIDGDPIDVYGMEKSRTRLNECLKSEEWLNRGDNRSLVTLVGTRIPVQGLNSMEFMEVYEFLPGEAGNIIIPPTEIVAKSGSDFDVDKLTVFKMNIGDNAVKLKQRFTSYAEANQTLDRIISQKFKLIKDVKIYVQSLRQEIQDIKKIKDSEFKDLVKAREYAKFERDIYLNEIKDIIDSIDYRTELIKYQHLSISNLMDSIGNISQEVDLKDLDENLYNYYNELMKIDQTYKDADRIINGFNMIRQDNYHTIEQVRTQELKELFDLSDSIREAFEGRRNITKVAENNLIESMKAILEMPQNYHDLVTPNTTKDVAGLSSILSYRSKDKKSEKSQTTSKLVEPVYNNSKFEENFGGKAALSLSAIDNTMNNMFNKAGAYMNNFYSIGDASIPVVIHLAHNTINVDGKEHISLSSLTDVNGKNKISDIISQIMNGQVDVGKDAWVFYINGGLEGAPIMLLLNQVGTPISDIAHFMTQSIVMDYTTKLRGKNNMFDKVVNSDQHINFDDKVRTVMMSELLGLKPKVITNKQTGKINTYPVSMNDVRTFMRKSELTEQYKDEVFSSKFLEQDQSSNEQKAVLLYQYFQLEDLAKKVKDVKGSLNFDTNKAKDSITVLEKQQQYQTTLDTNLFPAHILKALRDDSVISSFNIQRFNVAMQEILLPLRNSTVINNYILSKKEDIPVAIRAENFDRFARVFKNDLMSYILQNEVTQNTNIHTWFHGTTSAADRLFAIKKANPELVEKYPLLKNLIKNKSRQKSNESDVDPIINIKLIEGSMDTDKINIYHEQFKNLTDADVMKVADIEENKKLSNFFAQLAVFGLLQSGLNKSDISWTEIIPQDMYTKLMTQPVEKFTKLMNSPKAEATLNEFYDIFQDQNQSTFHFEHDIDDRGTMVENDITNKEPKRFKDYKKFKKDKFGNLIPKVVPSVVKEVSQQIDSMTKKNLFTVTPFQSVDKKAIVKASIATQYIGFGEGIKGSSTDFYGKQIIEQTNNNITSTANIPQNLVSGIEQFGTKQEANEKSKNLLGNNPHSIDMIEAGVRTRTTRSVGEMEKYNIKVGDIVKQFGKSADGTIKTILTKITAIHFKGTPGFLETWSKEGWTKDGVKAIERFKDGAAAIEFEVVENNNIVNSGNYSNKDTIFVSIGGKRGGDLGLEQQTKTIKEAIKAIEFGATLITDNVNYIHYNSKTKNQRPLTLTVTEFKNEDGLYNLGEKRLYENLKSKGYNYSEQTVDGQTIGVWKKSLTSVVTPVVQSTLPRTTEYTPKGKQTQTYTIVGAKIMNKDGVEVFKEDSVDRNKIFANIAVKEMTAVVVKYETGRTDKEGKSIIVTYVVNKKGTIISAISGEIMKWAENHGTRKAVTEQAANQFLGKEPGSCNK